MLDPTTKALLSQEETLALLALLNIQTLPGLPGLSSYGASECQMTALAAGERSLRARGLARLDADGRVQVPADLLALIAACGYAHGSLIVNQVAGARVQSCFAHRRDADLAFHTMPEAGLHQFEAAHDKAELTAAMAEWAGWRVEPPVPADPLTVSRGALEAARAAAQAGDVAAAQQRLSAAAPQASTAARFAVSLAQPYTVTIVQALRTDPSAAVAMESLSVLGAADQQWLLTEVAAAEAAEPTFVIETATRALLMDRIVHLGW